MGIGHGVHGNSVLPLQLFCKSKISLKQIIKTSLSRVSKKHSGFSTAGSLEIG